MYDETWRPGDDTRVEKVICCPNCGSISVHRHQKASQSIDRWMCDTCKKHWRRMYSNRIRVDLCLE